MGRNTEKKSILIQVYILVIFTCILSPLLLISCESEPEITELDKQPQVYIEYPPYGHHFVENKPLTLKGSALDFNGDFSDQIQWSSDRDGKLGVGSEITIKLSRGKHIIKASADNGYILGEYEIPITIYSKIKRKKVNTPKNKILEVRDRDGDLFIVNRKKRVITDTSTGLMWERDPDSYQYTYSEAVEYAHKSRLGGYSDWRLPTLSEASDIHNIYYDGRSAVLHNEFQTFEGKFWTQTTPSNVNFKAKHYINQIDFYGNTLLLMSKKGYTDVNSLLYVRLVRNTK